MLTLKSVKDRLSSFETKIFTELGYTVEHPFIIGAHKLVDFLETEAQEEADAVSYLTARQYKVEAPVEA